MLPLSLHKIRLLSLVVSVFYSRTCDIVCHHVISDVDVQLQVLDGCCLPAKSIVIIGSICQLRIAGVKQQVLVYMALTPYTCFKTSKTTAFVVLAITAFFSCVNVSNFLRVLLLSVCNLFVVQHLVGMFFFFNRQHL